MTKPDFILPQTLMRELLDNSCSNPYYPEDFDWDKANVELAEWNSTRGDAPAKQYPDPPGGWNKYTITLCCSTFIIIARKRHNKRTKKDSWQIKSYMGLS